MATIYTRATKGSALSWTEGDANITNLNNDKIESVVEDTTPQLGGNLDVNGNKIVSVSNGNIVIEPDGTGDVQLVTDTLQVGDSGATSTTITTNGTSDLILNTNNGSNSSRIQINDGSSGDIVIASNTFITLTNINSNATIRRTDTSSAALPTLSIQRYRSDIAVGDMDGAVVSTRHRVGGSSGTSNFADIRAIYKTDGTHYFELVTSNNNFTAAEKLISFEQTTTALGNNDGTATHTLTTNHAGNLELTTDRGSNSGLIKIVAGIDGNIEITPNGVGAIVLDGLNWPTADGTTGQFLTTDGEGNLSWANGGGFSGTLAIEDGGTGASTALEAWRNLQTYEAFNEDTALTNASAYVQNIYGMGDVVVTLPETATIGFSTGFLITNTSSGPVTIETFAEETVTVLESGRAMMISVANTSNDTVDAWLFYKLGFNNVVQDSTPQLGGDLDVNGKTITSASNGNIVIAPNGTGVAKVNNINYYEKTHSLGTTSGTITPDAANGNVQTITLNGNLTINDLANPVTGQSLTLIINTNGTGRTLSSTMKFSGGAKTLSATSTTDILSIFYDGANYWASLSTDFK